MKKVIVIGGGPAGMTAAGIAAENGNDVILMEKNNKLGRKLYITGKGRCNVTNASDPEELIVNTPGNPYFLYSAFYGFTSSDVMGFFEKLGVKLKIERGKRVFPVSDKSSDIVKALERFLKKNKVKVMLETKVTDIIIKEGKAAGVISTKGEYEAQSVIIATGGLAYPITGSTGDGYRFAKKVGHNVNGTYPSLVPLVTNEKWCARLQGLSLKNIEIKVKISGKTVYSDFGEMMFTHFGVTGPLILSASRYVTQRIKERAEIYVDLKPALNEKELDKRILRDFEKYINKEFKNSLDDLLPQNIIPVIIE
ncbi:MAG: aminoacetone oxidase family FAD-binding enzyme, partial [Firmicutes bacterium]|nr:aminoacetone oxidase family FAD-binding enzyme [Bacillota bacterium]